MAHNTMSIVADRWMMESRQLVNWGTYGGWHEFDPSMDEKLPMTLLAGASESGKSTLVDAQISLLYPKGTPFNKASNTGRSERNDYTYLRGMVGMSDTAYGEQAVYLRGTASDGTPQPVWGAIVDTYVNQATGETLSCAKFMYVQAGDTHSNVRRLFVTWDKKIDPRLMDRFRDTMFTPKQLKQTYPGAMVYQTAESFHAYIWEEMGLSAESCRLLHKIQSADAPSRLDDIFKQGVLGVPQALGQAREIVRQYDEYAENFRSMADKQARIELLEDVSRRYRHYETTRDKTSAFDVIDPSREDGAAVLRRWVLTNFMTEVDKQLPVDESDHQRLLRDVEDASRQSRELGQHIADVDAKIRGIDGGSLDRLEAERQQAAQLITETQVNSARLTTLFARVGDELPGTVDEWDRVYADAEGYEEIYQQRISELDDATGQATLAVNTARTALAQAQEDFDRANHMRSRISQKMNAARDLLCKATGLSVEDMPYIAELMDVREDAEDWRHAMNAIYGSLAQTILVDRVHEEGFAANVSTIDPKILPSRTWRFVDLSHDSSDLDEQAPADHDLFSAMESTAGDGEEWLSKQLRFRDESPFADWLRSRVTDRALDAVCVDAIDDLDEATRQVQRDGQIKSGKRGRYGMKDRDEVIGFVTQSYLDALQEEVNRAQGAMDDAMHQFEAIRKQRDELGNRRTLAATVLGFDWNHVDVTGARQRLDAIEQQIEAIKSNPELEALGKRRDALERDRSAAEKKRVLSEQAAEGAQQAIDAAGLWLEAAHADEQQRGRVDGSFQRTTMPTLDVEAEELLNATYIELMTSVGNSAERAHRIVGNGTLAYTDQVTKKIGNAVARELSQLDTAANNAAHDVVTAMETYRSRFEPNNDSVGIAIDDFPFYRDELAGLQALAAAAATADEYRRTLEQIRLSLLTLQRSMKTDREDIDEQLNRINTMLKGQDFGPRHGELSLEVDVRNPNRSFINELREAINRITTWRKDQDLHTTQPITSSDMSLEQAKRERDDAELPHLKQLFDGLKPLINMLQAELSNVHDMNGIKDYGAVNLDPRCRSSFYAIVHHDNIGEPDERITSTGGRSGGALQELTSFVYGAALIYLLGNGVTTQPCYTTLFLDEALIKADGRYTQRALNVLPRLGFQVIVSAPESKTGEILEVSTKAYVTYKDPQSGLTSLREADLIEDSGGEDNGSPGEEEHHAR